MTKLLLSLSCFSLMLLVLGAAFFSQSPVFWTASTDTAYQVIRLLLIMILLIQIFTEPPRTFFFRFLSGIIALSVGFWAIEATYNYHMMLLDTFSLLSAAVAIGVTALEIDHTSDEYLPHPQTS